eukprot:scaffold155622_cov77-Cyclotella_meneghiniana.AAC.2
MPSRKADCRHRSQAQVPQVPQVQSYEEDDDTFTLVYQKKALDPNAEQAIFFAFAEDTNELLIDEVDISGDNNDDYAKSNRY